MAGYHIPKSNYESKFYMEVSWIRYHLTRKSRRYKKNGAPYYIECTKDGQPVHMVTNGAKFASMSRPFTSEETKQVMEWAER